MRASCNWRVGLFLIGSLIGSLTGSIGAAALNAPRTLHRAKGPEPHLTESHRAASHRSTAHVGTPAARQTTAPASATHSAAKAAPARQPAHLTARGQARASARRVALTSRRHHSYERFTANSFATSDIFAGDVTAGEDPVVRQAAIDAMGGMNGTAVVIDPSNGRILAMVNQKLALSPGAEPCSTIKITVAMAALSEGLVTRDTMVKLDGFRMNMTQALAKSNNLYFEELGRELGFDRVRHYANQFGLGELAGYNIDGEQLGVYPDTGAARRRGRRGTHVQLRPGRFTDPAATGRVCCSPRQRRNPLLSAAPHHPRGSIGSAAKGQADPGYCPVLARHRGRYGWRGGVRYRAALARQLPGIAGLRQDRDLLGQRNPLRLVRIIFRFAAGQPGDGLSSSRAVAPPSAPAPLS